MTQHWIVYVDETGDFSAEDMRSFVVGWMTRADDKRSLESLEAELAKVAPWLPRPLHTRFLRHAAWHGLSLLVRVKRQSPQWFSRLFLSEQAVEHLRASLNDCWKDLEAFVRAREAILLGFRPP